ncbi:hypothetical protein RQX22_16450, partial [Sphingosinicella sp. GR2756]|nr:hypothetical protein [Sphingosinicella sp. GR2756]
LSRCPRNRQQLILRNEAMDADIQGRVAATTINDRLLDAPAIAWLVTMLASPKNIALNGETIQAGGGFRSVINY